MEYWFKTNIIIKNNLKLSLKIHLICSIKYLKYNLKLEYLHKYGKNQIILI